MISKRLATALGTGTLGAGGAGAAAWNLGLFGGNGLGVNEVNGTDQQLNAVPSSSPVGPQAGASQESATKNQGSEGRGSQSRGGTGGGTGGGVLGPLFQGATERDRKAIDSGSNQNWSSTVPVSGGISVVINNGNNSDTSNLWSCRLEAVILESTNSIDRSEFKRQGKELVGKIKNDDKKRLQFAKNCSDARTQNEQEDGGTGKIYLETEKTTGSKFKFKDQGIEDLLNRDFTGVYKLGDDEEEIADIYTTWNIVEGGVKDPKKITFFPVNKEEWKCSISSKIKSSKTFKKEGLEKILKMGDFGGSDPIEKKRYLIRNCMKNNKDIRGLEIQEYGDGWEFKNLEKITEGMYENPENA